MSKTILAVNAGSSSIKVSLYVLKSSPKGSTSPNLQQCAQVSVSGLTAPPATLSYTRGEEKQPNKKLDDVHGPQDAFPHILDTLIQDSNLTIINKAEDIQYIAHRIVHGGDYDAPVRLDRDSYHHLEALSVLAPLHNAVALEIVKTVHQNCPQATNYAFFDSAFHTSIPTASKTYMIDPSVAKRNKLHRYGFHGLSYAYITRTCASYLHKPLSSTNLIALHLGSGCSVSAIQNGRSRDTSMGLTPLEGLPGATRSGSLDPSLIFHFTNHAGDLVPLNTTEMQLTTAEKILNKESGWKAVTGTTDFGEVIRRMKDGDAQCRLAFDVLVDRLVGYIGSYFVKLGGKVDALVFAGGIGEKGAELRKAIVDRVAVLGFRLDDERNGNLGDGSVERISREGEKLAILVCQTDEQAEMADQYARIIGESL